MHFQELQLYALIWDIYNTPQKMKAQDVFISSVTSLLINWFDLNYCILFDTSKENPNTTLRSSKNLNRVAKVNSKEVTKVNSDKIVKYKLTRVAKFSLIK